MKNSRVEKVGDGAPAANDDPNAVYKWLGPTYFGLMAEFGAGEVKLIQLNEKYLGMSELTAKNEAAAGNLPFPVYRNGGQKGPWLVDLKAFANYLDENKRTAAEKFLAKRRLQA